MVVLLGEKLECRANLFVRVRVQMAPRCPDFIRDEKKRGEVSVTPAFLYIYMLYKRVINMGDG